MSKNKLYFFDKKKEKFICLCHNKKFNDRKILQKHLLKHKEFTPYDKHFHKQCSQDSRICRYCHPEIELSDIDHKKSKKYYGITTSNKNKIERLLIIEARYRNKFSKEHMKQLKRCYSRKKSSKISLYNMIKSRLEKRQRKKPKNDGLQTPYVAHGIDVSMHTCAVCCRGCINRWHGFTLDRDLSDEEIDYLTNFVYYYLTKYILVEDDSNKSVKKWMKEKREDEESMYYEPGDYEIYWKEENPRVRKIGDGFQDKRNKFIRKKSTKK